VAVRLLLLKAGGGMVSRDQEGFEMEKAETGLQATLQAKFDEICNFVSSHLGYGDFSQISEAERHAVIEDVKELTKNWHETTFGDWDLAPRLELQRLLAAYQEIGELILDLEDEDIERRYGDIE
jgi:hypothetical protein